MSQHPRLAGDGRLTLPAKVAFDDQGFIRGRFSAQDVDPFEPTADKLLLAESFARLELDDRAAWKAWIVRHGALDPYDLFDGDGALPDDGEWAEDRPEGAFAESRDEWLAEQANVRWHLSVLERLSDARETRVWEPAWGAFVLDAGAFDNVLVGGEHAGARVWPDESLELVERYPHARARYGDAATQRLVRAEAAARTRILVRQAGWHLWFGPRVGPGGDLDPLPDVAGLGGTWASMLEVERRLIEPYVAAAVERRFRIELVTSGDRGVVFLPREDRLWVSILAPIYLQLFEALRRITEGEPGAAICRECRRPFLVLDARRRFFCNDRERFRNAQRERRRRSAGGTGTAALAIVASLDATLALERTVRADLAGVMAVDEPDIEDAADEEEPEL